jgi:hypothetical protein
VSIRKKSAVGLPGLLLALLALTLLFAPAALATGDVNQPVCNHELEGFPGATTESSPGFRAYLPDCRAYELVTPAYTGGGFPKGVEKYLPPMSADGEHVLSESFTGYAGTGNLENSTITDYGAIYEFSRTPTGWTAEALDPPASLAPRRIFDFPSADLSRSLWELQLAPHAGEEFPISPPNAVTTANNATIAVREAAGGGKGNFALVGPIAASGHEPSQGDSGEPAVGGGVVGASAELTHILVEALADGKQTWPGDETLENDGSLYEYDSVGEAEPVLVGVSNEGSVVEAAGREDKAHVNEAAHLISRCGVRLGGRNVTTAENAISASGDVVYFTALECPGGPSVNELYARVGSSRTVKISGGGESAEFQGASQDGSKVFFSEGESLFEYDLEAERLTLLAGEVTGAVTSSQDGQRVYFSSDRVLTSYANANGETAEPLVANTYVYDTGTGRLAFVAREAAAVDTTRDGQYFVFASREEIRGTNDTSTAVSQLFEYDAETGTVVRVSKGQHAAPGFECDTTHIVEEGYDCDGNTAEYEPLPPPQPQTNIHDSFPDASTSNLAVSADGTVVFMSPDALTPLSVLGGENVYEYRAGNVYLVSPGGEAASTAPAPTEGSRLKGISETGENVFFATTEPLVAQDTGTQSSWYDAREGGGFPAPVAQPSCVAEACQGALGAAPTLSSPLAPPSVNENLAPPVTAPAVTPKPKAKAKAKECKKGFVKKKGKCVKAPKSERASKSNRRSK